MTRARFSLLILALFVSLTVSARDTRKEMTVNLKFSPQEGVASNTADLPPGVLDRSVELRVEDRRKGDDPLQIGSGTNDDDDTFPIRASSDVVAFVKESLVRTASNWGLKDTAPVDRILKIGIVRFNVEESNKAVGSLYVSDVGITYTLTDKAGKKLAEGSASGSARRYGRARSSDNCSEVLSDALKEAFADAMSDSRLHDAWESGKPSSR